MQCEVEQGAERHLPSLTHPSECRGRAAGREHEDAAAFLIERGHEQGLQGGKRGEGVP